MLLPVLEQALLFLPLALGIYISYGVLKIADLTTDGSFVLGAALFAISLHLGLPAPLALIGALLGGTLAGIAVSLSQAKLRLNPLLSGILWVFILNALTLKLMGKPNLSLLHQSTLFYPHLGALAGFSLALLLLITLLLRSRVGLLLRAFGNNQELLNLMGKRAERYRMIGLSLSNALVACSGALTAEASGYVDYSMGTGMVLIALGTVLIGEKLFSLLFRSPSFLFQLFSCFLGIMLYFSIVRLFIALGLDPIYLRLMMAVCLLFFLGMTKRRVA